MAKSRRNLLVKVIDYLRSFAGMDSDSSYSSFREGRYLSALNVRHTSQQGSTGNDIQNILGSTNRFTIAAVAAGDQTTRFYFNNPTIGDIFTLALNDWNGQPLMTPLTFTVSGSTFTDKLNNFITAIESALLAGNQNYSVHSTTTGTNSGYVFVTIFGTLSPSVSTTGRGWNDTYYYTENTLTYASETGALTAGEPFTSANGVNGVIVSDNASTTVVAASNQAIALGDIITGTNSGHSFTVTASANVVSSAENYYSAIVAEAIDQSIIGIPVNIGSYDILGRLWSMWSPQNNLAVNIGEGNAITIGSTGGGSPIFQVTFANPHGLTELEAISISNISITPAIPPCILNGYWIVHVVSATVINLLGSVYNSNFTAPTTANPAVVVRYPFGYGMISGEEQNQNDQTFSGAVVLRSKELNFRIPYQIDIDCDLTDKYDTYFTDNENVMRVFYYTGALITDGAINALNPDGEYSYGSIDLATQLIVAQPKIKLTFTGQLQTGGNTPCGNHRAAVRLVTTAGGTPTLWTALDNPVPVYQQPFNSSVCEYVYGNDPLSFATKINQYQVTGIDTSVYQYLDLADVVYSGQAVSGIIVTRYTITSPTMNIQYTGYENDTTPLDVTTLGAVSAAYVTAKNIRILDNYLVLSNLTTDTQYDLTTWASRIDHLLFKQPLDSAPNTNGNANDFFQPEYASPTNVNQYVGYMLNETYRFGVQVRWKDSGVWSQSYFVQDIPFDTNGSYPRRIAALANYDLTNPLVVATGGINNNAGACQVLVPAIKFQYNIEYLLPDGKNLSDVIDGIRFVRAECIPEVKASGIAIQSVFGSCSYGTSGVGTGVYGWNNSTAPATYFGEYPFALGWQSPSLDFSNGTPGYFDWITNNPTYPNGGSAGFNNSGNPQAYQFCPFYSADIFFGNIEFNNNDANNDNLYILNSPANQSIFGSQGSNQGGNYVSNTFSFIDVSGGQSAIDSYTIDESQYISENTQASFAEGIYTKSIFAEGNGGDTIVEGLPSLGGSPIFFVEGSPVFHVTRAITPLTSSPNGLLYAQWFRPINNKYGNPNKTIYISTGQERDLSSTDVGTLTDSVFGGDTFTQHWYLKIRRPNIAYDSSRAVNIAADLLGGSGSIKIYSQQRVNAQLLQPTGTPSEEAIFPGSFEGAIGGNPAFSTKMAEFNRLAYYSDNIYTSSYNIENNVVTYVGFNPLLEQITNYLARVAWSVLKPQGSLSDLFRVFQPLDFHDLESKYGGITHMEVLNGELLTLQIRKWMRQYFNARGTLQVQDVGEVVIGDGSVMSRDGVQLSQIGTRHKWSCQKGIDPAGKDTEYWWSADYKKLMRFAADGTKCISDANDIQSFMANNTQFVFNYDTPASNYGVSSVFDDRNNELVMTFMGQRQDVGGYDPDNEYEQGDVVKYIGNNVLGGYQQGVIGGHFDIGETFISKYGVTGIVGTIVSGGNITVYNLNKPFVVGDMFTGQTSGELFFITSIISTPFITYEQTGEFYISLIDGNTGNAPDLNPADWMIIPHQDEIPFPVPLPNGLYPHDYYSEFTIAFGEKRNTFHSFYTPKPKTYLKYLDSYLAPDPQNQGNVYEFNTGYDTNNWCMWFNGNNQDGNVYLVFCRPNNASKMFDTYEFNSVIVPARIDAWTKATDDNNNPVTLQTYMLQSDFGNLNGQWAVAIKNDILSSATGSNEDDTSKMWGDYLITKVTLSQGVFQKIAQSIIKYVSLGRDFRS